MNFKGCLNDAKYWTKKHLPDIMMALGLSGVCVGTGIAIKKSLDHDKIEKIAEKNDREIKVAKKCKDKKELPVAYAKAGLNIAKYYAVPATLFFGGIGSIVYSHVELNSRNAALSAAYTTVAGLFAKYRANVVEKYGEKIDQELRHDIKITNDKGEVKKAELIDKKNSKKKSQFSDYAAFYDESCPNFSKKPGYNLFMIRRVESYMNDILQSRAGNNKPGVVFLNEVYHQLGLDYKKSPAGQHVGWTYYKDGNNLNGGDNYISFGLFDVNNESARNFVNGVENTVLLDFNVDGNVIDLL